MSIDPSSPLPEGIGIGHAVSIGRDVLLRASMTVGERVRIAARVIFADDRSDATVLQDGVRIGPAAVIGAGVRVGHGAEVRPGAVVMSDVPPNAIVEGNPARIVGYIQTTGPATGAPPAGPAGPAPREAPAVQRLGVGEAALYRMRRVADLRGALTVGEVDRELPFEPKRYFLVFDVPSEELRGEHAHRRCHQFLLCAHGACTLLLDDGRSRSEVRLDRPELGVHMPPMTWGTQYRYSRDAVLLVFASEHYDPDDYIRTYDEFLEEVNGKTRPGA
jgi:dTDP-4-dehydrorhamnose 3,5-epimerase-like enzyme